MLIQKSARTYTYNLDITSCYYLNIWLNSFADFFLSSHKFEKYQYKWVSSLCALVGDEDSSDTITKPFHLASSCFQVTPLISWLYLQKNKESILPISPEITTISVEPTNKSSVPKIINVRFCTSRLFCSRHFIFNDWNFQTTAIYT